MQVQSRVFFEAAEKTKAAGVNEITTEAACRTSCRFPRACCTLCSVATRVESSCKAAFREAIAGHAVVLVPCFLMPTHASALCAQRKVYFSYGPRTAELPFSLGRVPAL